MTFVKTVPVEAASGLVKEQYDHIRQHTGASEVLHLVRSWSIQPEVAGAWQKSLRTAREASGLDNVLYELMECRIMYLLKCRYVLVNHCYLLARASNWEHDRIKQLVHAPETSDIGVRERAVLRFAGKAALRSHEITKADVDAIRAVGFTDEQYVALVFTISALVANAIFPNALGPELDEFSKAYRDIADW